MHSVYKCRKHFKEVEVEGNEDRISHLPNSLISHILSFIPTKNAVATSVLSTRWKYLWTSVTNLDFDDELLGEPINPRKCTKRKLRLVEMNFINFVNRVLMRNTSDLQTFRMRCTRSYEVSNLNFLVSTALARNLCELHLFFKMEGYNGLPREIFTCTSLVALELVGRFILNVPTLVCMQNLKILLIESLEFLDDEAINRLFSGCPLLEELSIKRCDFKNISMFHISAPALKSLIIDCWSKSGYKLVLNTPNLQDLKYHDFIAEGYSVNKLNALVNADITFVSRCRPVHDGSVEELLAEFVEGISNAQRLHLSDYPIKAFRLRRFPLPKFDHLTCLEIGGCCRHVTWKLLLGFLESSPQLEILIFGGLRIQRDKFQENQTATCNWYQPENVPSCLLFHLKRIKIMWFKGKIDELKMAEYFLKNSKVLEELKIHPSNSRNSVAINIVRKFPRGSEKCRVMMS